MAKQFDVKDLNVSIGDITKEIKAELENNAAKAQPVANEMLKNIAASVRADAPTVNNVYIQTENNSNMVRYTGTSPGAKLENSAKFFSSKKSLTLYITNRFAVIFRERSFFTDNEDLKELIRNHPLFGIEIWENAFPSSFVRKLNDDNKYITRDPEFYND